MVYVTFLSDINWKRPCRHFWVGRSGERKLAPFICMSYTTYYPPFQIATLHKITRKKYREYRYQIFSILAITIYYNRQSEWYGLWTTSSFSYIYHWVSPPWYSFHFFLPQDGTREQTFWNAQWIREVRFKVFRTIGYANILHRNKKTDIGIWKMPESLQTLCRKVTISHRL